MLYKVGAGKYPENLKILQAQGSLIPEHLKDAWGNEFLYELTDGKKGI